MKRLYHHCSSFMAPSKLKLYTSGSLSIHFSKDNRNWYLSSKYYKVLVESLDKLVFWSVSVFATCFILLSSLDVLKDLCPFCLHLFQSHHLTKMVMTGPTRDPYQTSTIISCQVSSFVWTFMSLHPCLQYWGKFSLTDNVQRQSSPVNT